MAARPARRSPGCSPGDVNRTVLLLEAGPDYGHVIDGNWPAELLDARSIPTTHDWGYTGVNHPTQTEPGGYERARVIGGCSSHNGCVALLGHRHDYDHWSEIGNDGWAWNDVESSFQRAMRALKLRIPGDQELTPYQAAFVHGSVDAGIPRVDDLNDPDSVAGVAPSPVNIYNGTRWNTALAYLDPVRHQGNLTVVGDALVDRVNVDGRRATAVEAIIDGESRRFAADHIVLAAGAYGSPSILLRSGVGPADDLARLGIDLVADLPGVGHGLTDHPMAGVQLQPTGKLLDATAVFETVNWSPDEQALLKARSSHCQEAFDLHLFAVSGTQDDGSPRFTIEVSSVAPVSSGRLQIRSTDPETAPDIDHGYLSDPAGHDLDVMFDGVKLALRIGENMRQAGLIGAISDPDRGSTDDELRRWIEERVGVYYHPACSCRMGPATDRMAVVDPRGQVHGIDGLSICDASIFPAIMRANTNLPAAMLAEHMAVWIGN